MKYPHLPFSLVLLTVCIPFLLAFRPPSLPALKLERTEKGSSPGTLKVVVLEGAPYNRGLIHGRTLKKEIAEVHQLWQADIEKNYQMKAEDFTARFLRMTDFKPAIQRWAPELLEEIKGIADGSGVDFDTVLMMQLGDEQWAQGAEVSAQHCTSLGIDRQGRTPSLVAQNMDIEPFYQGYQTLLHIKDSQTQIESFVLTTPGLIGLNGMNNRGIAITCNSLLQLEPSRNGLPVAFLVREVLRQPTFEAAVGLVTEVPHASGQNYLIGGPRHVVSIECSARQTRPFLPFPGAKMTYHTNHPLANDNFNPKYLAQLKKLNRTVEQGAYYCFRFESLEKRLRQSTQAVGIEVIKATLRSQDSTTSPISNPSTFGSSIMVLSDPPVLHLAPGQPHLTEYRTFTFTARK
ncbi:MAG: hypothetical protein K1Y36_08920 [Blastocatellia bacterium]|nr:hypothetical protein [Blastocatellia bacterium]